MVRIEMMYGDLFDGIEYLYEKEYKKEEAYKILKGGCNRFVRQVGMIKGMNYYKGIEKINDNWYGFTYVTRNFRYYPNIRNILGI